MRQSVPQFSEEKVCPWLRNIIYVVNKAFESFQGGASKDARSLMGELQSIHLGAWECKRYEGIE